MAVSPRCAGRTQLGQRLRLDSSFRTASPVRSRAPHRDFFPAYVEWPVARTGAWCGSKTALRTRAPDRSECWRLVDSNCQGNVCGRFCRDRRRRSQFFAATICRAAWTGKLHGRSGILHPGKPTYRPDQVSKGPSRIHLDFSPSRSFFCGHLRTNAGKEHGGTAAVAVRIAA